MPSNPRCLISQIAVTFEGDGAGVRGGTRPRQSVYISVCFSLCLCFPAAVVFDDAYSADPAVPSLL